MLPVSHRQPAASSWGRLQRLLLPLLALLATSFLALHFLSPYYHPGGSPGYREVSMISTKHLDSSTKKQLTAYCQARKPDQNLYFVTGAAGFIGFHLSGALTKRGDLVVGFDNFNAYYPVSLKRSRAAALLATHKVPVVEADLNDYTLLMELFEVCQFSHVVHLAAQAGVRYAKKSPHTYVASNLAGFVNLLEVMVHQKQVPRYIYASSSSVYGATKNIPFSELDRADVPTNLYAATKRSGELLSYAYMHLYGLSGTGLRFFTVYGPWGRPDMSVLSFARNIMDGKPIKVFRAPDGGELARDFTFIDDIVAGILGACDHTPPSVKGQARHAVYNLGNTAPATVTQLVDLLEKHLGKKAIRNHQPLPAAGEVLKTHANISAARTDLAYNPHTSLDEGVKQFVEWFKVYYGPDGSKKRADEVQYVPD